LLRKEDIMETSKVYFNFSNTASTNKTSKEFDKNTFLQILTAQLRNQDPMNAKDNTEYIAQMAQFSSLEQMQNLNTTMEQLLSSQKFTEGAMLVGHAVGFQIDDNNYVKDIVNSVMVENGRVTLITESGKYTLDQVVGVGDLPSVNQVNNNTINKLDPNRQNYNSRINRSIEFGKVLEHVQKQNDLKISAHAMDRLAERNIKITDKDMVKLKDAVENIRNKGGKEALILYNNIAFITSIRNSTIITAVDSQNMKENVFTNIDSAVVL
jgi:flagellar basal-body rod modification protein FlgD